MLKFRPTVEAMGSEQSFNQDNSVWNEPVHRDYFIARCVHDRYARNESTLGFLFKDIYFRNND